MSPGDGPGSYYKRPRSYLMPAHIDSPGEEVSVICYRLTLVADKHEVFPLLDGVFVHVVESAFGEPQVSLTILLRQIRFGDRVDVASVYEAQRPVPAVKNFQLAY